MWASELAYKEVLGSTRRKAETKQKMGRIDFGEPAGGDSRREKGKGNSRSEGHGSGPVRASN